MRQKIESRARPQWWIAARAAVTLLGIGLVPTWANGAPLFGPSQPYQVGTSPVGLVAGEFDGEQGIDLASAEEGNTISLLANLGNGTFTPADRINVSDRFTVTGVVRGRFNDDGIDDLAISADDLGSFPQFHGAIVLYESTAPLRFDENPIPIGLFPACITIGQVNGDDVPDLASCTTTADVGGSVSYALGPSFSSAPEIPLGDIAPTRLVAGDLDGDTRPDLIAVDTGRDAVWVMYGRATPPLFDSPVKLVDVASPTAVAVGRFNDDSLPDVAVTSGSEGSVTILIQGEPRSFDSSGSQGVGIEPVDLAVADVTNDSVSDLLVVNFLSNDVRVLIGQGNGTFSLGERIPVGTGPVAIAVADFNDDGRQDIATANQDDQSLGDNTQTVSVALNAFGDASCDGAVNSDDLPALVAQIFAPVCPTADLNADGRVTAADLILQVEILTGS